MYYHTNYNSPLGKMLFVSDGEAICGVWFYNQKFFKSTIDESVRKDDLEVFVQLKSWFDDYFRGLNPQINFKLNLMVVSLEKRYGKFYVKFHTARH